MADPMTSWMSALMMAISIMIHRVKRGIGVYSCRHTCARFMPRTEQENCRLTPCRCPSQRKITEVGKGGWYWGVQKLPDSETLVQGLVF